MKYDLIVVGGGTAGCATAFIAAKKGLKTLLLEKNSYLGGSMTGGYVLPAMKSADNQINTSFFDEFCKSLNEIGGQITYSDGNKGWFNPELAKIVLDRMLTDAGVEIYFNTHINKIYVEKDIVKAIDISFNQNITVYDLSVPIETSIDYNKIQKSNVLSEHIETKYIIDATGNQEICKNLNCRFIDDDDKKQPASLRFILSGVDIERFEKFITTLDKDTSATSSVRIGEEIHLSTACTWDKEWALTPLFKKAVEEGVLKEYDRAYFQLFTIPGMASSIAFNCPRFTEDVGLESLSASAKAIKTARESILRLTEFCKHYMEGFENAYISNIAPLVGIRTSIRALGKYLYSIDDLKNGKVFENPVLVSNYPIDIHSDKKEGAVLEKVYQNYQLPVESLMSADYDNLYFVGRGISADFYAQAALRIIPSCFSMGEGLANYIANLGD